MFAMSSMGKRHMNSVPVWNGIVYNAMRFLVLSTRQEG
jgi:hypothetical protein